MGQRPCIREGQVVPKLAVRAVDPCPQKRVARETFDPLVGERLNHRESIVVRRLEKLGVEVTEQSDDVRIPRPPKVTRQLFELRFQLPLRRHGFSLYPRRLPARHTKRKSRG